MGCGEGLPVGFNINEADIHQLLGDLGHAGQGSGLPAQGINLVVRTGQNIGGVLLALLINEREPMGQELP